MEHKQLQMHVIYRFKSDESVYQSMAHDEHAMLLSRVSACGSDEDFMTDMANMHTSSGWHYALLLKLRPL
jgi:hypothetical protein